MASVRMRWGRRLLVLPLGLALLASACASTPEPNPHSPDVRLAALLDAWQQARRDDGGCQQRRPEETPLIDCERLRKQVERLAIEFPNHPDVLLANAVLAFESGKPDDAQKDLDVLRRLNPIQPKASVLRARIAIEDGNGPAAVARPPARRSAGPSPRWSCRTWPRASRWWRTICQPG